MIAELNKQVHTMCIKDSHSALTLILHTNIMLLYRFMKDIFSLHQRHSNAPQILIVHQMSTLQ